MNKKEKRAAVIAGLCGSLAAYLVIFIWKIPVDTRPFIISLTTLSSMSTGFFFACTITLLAFKLSKKINWKYAFVLGPLYGAAAGAITGAAVTVVVFPEYMVMSLAMGAVIGGLMGVLVGFFLGPALAFMARR